MQHVTKNFSAEMFRPAPGREAEIESPGLAELDAWRERHEPLPRVPRWLTDAAMVCLGAALGALVAAILFWWLTGK